MEHTGQRPGSEELAGCLEEVIASRGEHGKYVIDQGKQFALALKSRDERDARPQRVEKQPDEVLRILRRDS